MDETAGLVAAHADPEVLVVAGGRVKHMTTAMNDVLRRHFGDVQASLARQKSRVLVASRPRPADERPASTWPRSEDHPDLGVTVCAHGGVFAGSGIDIGTRALLQHVDAMPMDATSALDLGCGTGVLAVLLAKANDGTTVTATDESAARSPPPARLSRRTVCRIASPSCAQTARTGCRTPASTSSC